MKKTMKLLKDNGLVLEMFCTSKKVHISITKVFRRNKLQSRMRKSVTIDASEMTGKKLFSAVQSTVADIQARLDWNKAYKKKIKKRVEDGRM